MTKSAERRHDDMARVWHAAQIDITAWRFFEDEDPWRDLLAAGFAVYINTALCDALEEYPPHLWFPVMWCDGDGVGGKCPDDAATLYLGLHLGASDNSVCWSISLEDIVDDMIEDSTPVDDPKPFIKLAARLRELADKLDKAASVEPPELA